MKAKLIKTEVNYILEDDKGVVIASTSLNKEGLSLSIKNCQAIENGYDLDELAIKSSKEYFIKPIEAPIFTFGYEEGFQKALELMGDKKFSEADVISMIEKSRETGLTAQFLMLTKQQTEWDVEIEIEVVPDFYSRSDKDGSIFTSNKKEIPKLDSTGCLILKRI